MAGGLPQELEEVPKLSQEGGAVNNMTESMMTPPTEEKAASADVEAPLETDAMQQVSWPDICQRLRIDGDSLSLLLFRLFQERYEVKSAIDAFTVIPRFLGEYMVREFDYRDFCLQLNLVEESCLANEDSFAAFMAQHLTEHLVQAASLMLRLAATIAKAHDLQPCDWKDINDACSSAVRLLPACFRLQRALPGALSAARASRFLSNAADEVAVGNPWNNEKDRETFEDMYQLPWARVEALTASDNEVSSCCSACLRVKEVTTVDDVCLVKMEAVRPTIEGSPPGPFPDKALSEGSTILWEVEHSLGRLLLPGLMIEADWYQVQNELCFISMPVSVFPSWAS